MPTYKNIRIKMKGGKTRLQRVMVLASGKYKFVKNLTKSRSSPKRKGKTSKKGGKNMSRHKSLFQTFKKLALGGSLAAPAIATLMTPADKATKIQWLSRRYFGYDTKTGKFTLHDLKDGWGPFAVTVLVTTGISKARGMLRRL